MFGAMVVAPIIMGFDPNLAILFSGIGTLIFCASVGGADYTVTIGGFTVNGVALGAFAAIVLYAFFRGAPSQEDFAIVGDDADARAEMRAEGQ